MQFRHKIAGGDFGKAGNAASSVKKILRQLNIDHSISKRIVIALYEGEVNVVAHAYSGIIDADIDDTKIKITITDKGPGIADLATCFFKKSKYYLFVGKSSIGRIRGISGAYQTDEQLGYYPRSQINT